MKIYLDNCCFNRPYDDQNYREIAADTDAKLAIQTGIKTGKIMLVWSSILDFENSANSEKQIQREIFTWRSLASEIIIINEPIIARGKEFETLGFSKKDALHISCAIAAECDYFVTVDKGIIKKRDYIAGIAIKSAIEAKKLLEGENADGHRN